MKVALIMYGHLRTYKKCFDKLKENFLDTYNPDIFIHTWDETEARTRSWHNRHTKVEKVDRKLINEIKQMYNPKALSIDSQHAVANDKTTPNNLISAKGQQYMLYSMFAANKLKRDYEVKNNFRYDTVIKIRPDIMLLSPLTLTKQKPNCVSIAANRTVSTHTNNIHKYRACDIINIANSMDMDIICDVDKHFKTFFVDNVVNKRFIHSGFVDYMLSRKLKLEFKDYVYNKDWTIVREASK
jgi:hypothetical protein